MDWSTRKIGANKKIGGTRGSLHARWREKYMGYAAGAPKAAHIRRSFKMIRRKKGLKWREMGWNQALLSVPSCYICMVEKSMLGSFLSSKEIKSGMEFADRTSNRFFVSIPVLIITALGKDNGYCAILLKAFAQNRKKASRENRGKRDMATQTRLASQNHPYLFPIFIFSAGAQKPSLPRI